MKLILSFLILSFLHINVKSQITTTQGVPCIQAVDQLLGVGVNVSNVTCNCNVNALGSFQNANNLPIASGVILSTGNINQITNGGCVGGSSIGNGNGSTGTLNAIAGNSTFDQCTIEFDIVPTCNSLQISFFYGSDEYPEFVNSGYNDAFAFFITGPGIVGSQNLAVVPGTTTPVTINTINSGFNSGSYNSNGNCGNGIEFDGYTNQLTTFANVQQCQSYHMTITIADAGDASWDSGVFLLQNGLSCPNGAMSVGINKIDNFCGNECNGSIDLNISGGASPYFVSWEHTNSNATSLANLCDGDYIVDIIDNTCNQFKDTITINSTQSITAGFTNDTICLNNSTSYIDTSLLNNGAITNWEWSFGDGNNSTAQNPLNLYSTDGSYNTQLIVTTNLGCKDTINKTILVYPNPTTVYSVNDVCVDFTSTFTNSSTINSPDNISTYDWSFGDGNSSTLETPTHDYTSDGSYIVKLVTTSNNGCKDSLSLNTIVFPKPTANYTVDDDCVNIAAQFTDNSNVSSGSISTWEWDFGDATPIDNSQTPTHLYVNDNTYNTSLIVTSNNGCKDTLEVPTVRHAMPLVNFTSTPDCLYDPIPFTNLTTITSTSTITNYIWNFGDGSTFSTLENPNHIYPQSGAYNVNLIASSNNGCVSNIAIPTFVYPIPVANFTNTAVCVNKPPMYFIDISTISNGTINNWEWNFGDGNVGNFPLPSNNYPLSGSYDVQLIVTSDQNCKDTTSLPIVVDPKPTALFTTDIIEGCSPVCINYTDNSTANSVSVDTWFWNLGNGEANTNQNPTTCYINDDHINDMDYSVTLIVKNDKGCYDTITKTDLITSWHNPISLFTATPEEVNMYEAEISTFNNSTGADSYAWNFGDSTYSTEFEPLTIYGDTGVFNIVLAVSTLNNCVDTSNQEIKITPVISVYIPNAFTPNGDGSNDGFFYKGYGIDISTTQFSIFDRWGTLIYYTENNTPWNGTYKGKTAVQDSYTYTFRCKDVFGEQHEYIGHFLLLK